MLSRIGALVCLISLPLLVFAETPEQQRDRIGRLENAVLAPCCYRETVARHRSEVALKMRGEIEQWVREGKTESRDPEHLQELVRHTSVGGTRRSRILVDVHRALVPADRRRGMAALALAHQSSPSTDRDRCPKSRPSRLG